MSTDKDLRLGALRRFAVGITALNIVGHLVLGLEQSWAQYFVAVVAAWVIDATFEFAAAASQRRPTVFRRGFVKTADFLLPAHITANAVAMLLYPNDRLAPMFLAVAIALGTKRVLRVKVRGSRRHFLNPSNAGIVAVLLLFPSVGIAPPYQFTHHLHGAWAIVLPVALLGPATMVTVGFTKKVPLVLSWLLAFVVQALARSALFGFPAVVGLVEMTGTVFVLFTFYMMADPGTTPVSRRGQIAFGGAVAAMYGILQVVHVVFGLFFALAIVCLIRGAFLAVRARQARATQVTTPDDLEMAETRPVAADAPVGVPALVPRSIEALPGT